MNACLAARNRRRSHNGFRKPDQIALRTMEAGVKKAAMPLKAQLPLAFAAGAFIALGFLLAKGAGAIGCGRGVYFHTVDSKTALSL